jgi:FtsH-binding integral membrane protein
LVKIILGGLAFIATIIISIGFIPYQLWKMRFSVFWWFLFIIVIVLICISFRQIYPINSDLSYKKAIFSILTGFLMFILVWSINALDKTKLPLIYIFLITSISFKAIGGLVLGYGVFSLINLIF